MESHQIDSIIKNTINESENFYDSEAKNAKERIWNRVQLQKKSKQPVLSLLVAASILLFISFSIITISNIRNRYTITKLVELNSALRKEASINNKKPLINGTTATTNVKMHDTIYVKKKVIEYKSFVITKQITDTVYIQQILYVEKEHGQASLAVNNDKPSADSIFQKNENNYKSDIFISNNESLKKGRKIQIKFGGNKNQVNSGTLAFTAKL